MGLARNVRDLYTFVCRTYQPGDKIYAFGFSRGAFTIRILVSLVMDQGLVPYDGKEADLQRHVVSAYRAYRKTYKPIRTSLGRPLIGVLRRLRDGMIDARDLLLGRRRYREVDKIGGPNSAQPVTIEFLGLWDTVDAYGLPVDELAWVIDSFIWPMTMREYSLDPRVKRARHALALDDERNTFHPRLWNEEPRPGDPRSGVPGGNRHTTHIDQERVSQVWFAGAHSNVGGGYPDDSLAHVSLEWIMSEAEKYGMRFNRNLWAELRALSDENGPLYDSRHGLAGYYRYNPRRIEELTNTDKVVVKRTKVHESVFRRIKAGQDGYAPFVIPPDFAVVRLDGTIVDGAKYCGADIGKPFSQEREHVWNWVWWRRVAYFFTVFATLFVAMSPLIWPPAGHCTGPYCSIMAFILSALELIAEVSGFKLSEFAGTWTNVFSSHPGKALFLLSFIGFGLWAGRVLERHVRDSMRPIWYNIPSTTPHSVLPFSPPVLPSWPNRALQWLRTRRTCQKALYYLSHRVMPPVLFIPILGYIAVAIVSQASFAIRVSMGGVCESTGYAKTVLTPEQGRTFRTNALCASTGLHIIKGGTYRLRVVIPGIDPWTDNGIPAGPNGIHPYDVTLQMHLLLPLRRNISQPWFKPIARIGESGTDEYPLDPKPSLPAYTYGRRIPMANEWLDTCSGAAKSVSKQSLTNATVLRRVVLTFSDEILLPSGADITFETEFVARSEGELFLYVNDAVLHPWLTRLFYCDNEGSARVTVERVLSFSPAP